MHLYKISFNLSRTVLLATPLYSGMQPLNGELKALLGNSAIKTNSFIQGIFKKKMRHLVFLYISVHINATVLYGQREEVLQLVLHIETIQIDK